MLATPDRERTILCSRCPEQGCLPPRNSLAGDREPSNGLETPGPESRRVTTIHDVVAGGAVPLGLLPEAAAACTVNIADRHNDGRTKLMVRRNADDEVIIPLLNSRKNGAVKTALRVARAVLRDIVENDLPPGTRLPGEMALMKDYDVSRASMREALRILETYGFITVRPGPGGGAVVNSVDPVYFGHTTAMFLQLSRTTLSEVFEARTHLEPVLAKVGAELQLPEPTAHLRAQLERHRSFNEYDTAQYVELCLGFHVTVAQLTGNPVLELFAHSLQSIVRDRVGPVRRSSDRWRDVIDEHIAIAEAILTGNASEAHFLMEKHMQGFCEGYRKRYPTLIDDVVDGD